MTLCGTHVLRERGSLHRASGTFLTQCDTRGQCEIGHHQRYCKQATATHVLVPCYDLVIQSKLRPMMYHSSMHMAPWGLLVLRPWCSSLLQHGVAHAVRQLLACRLATAEQQVLQQQQCCTAPCHMPCASCTTQIKWFTEQWLLTEACGMAA